jgi:hypothetical protein
MPEPGGIRSCRFFLEGLASNRPFILPSSKRVTLYAKGVLLVDRYMVSQTVVYLSQKVSKSLTSNGVVAIVSQSPCR